MAKVKTPSWRLAEHRRREWLNNTYGEPMATINVKLDDDLEPLVEGVQATPEVALQIQAIRLLQKLLGEQPAEPTTVSTEEPTPE